MNESLPYHFKEYIHVCNTSW